MAVGAAECWGLFAGSVDEADGMGVDDSEGEGEGEVQGGGEDENEE